MNQDDQILRAVGLLSGIKENMPKNQSVTQRWADEYHSALSKIEEALGIKLLEFKVEDSAIKRRVTSSNGLTGEVNYSKEYYCDSRVLMQKLDSLLKYLDLLLQPPPPPEKKIGFKA